MTHPNFVTNGASLEDCHTNFFALADLAGIKWRRLYTESILCVDPLDDPVLSSYSKCLAVGIPCVWRRFGRGPMGQQNHHQQHHGGSHHHQGHMGHHHQGHMGGPNRGMGNGQGLGGHGPGPELHNQLQYNKELWIFWYGEEPDLSGLLCPDLISDPDYGTWESGLSYECRTLLFKSLHNLAERCLLSKDLTRLGKWFTFPRDEMEKSSKSPLVTFSLNYFVHGEGTVCVSLDVRHHPAVYRLSKETILAAQGSSSGLKVILSPYGLAGTLTGQSYKESDQDIQRLLSEWQQFYPLPPNESSGKEFTDDDDKLPSVVEVIVGGVKMRYPSSYVFVVDCDEITPNNKSGAYSGNAAQPSGQNAKGGGHLGTVLTPPNSPCEVNGHCCGGSNSSSNNNGGGGNSSDACGHCPPPPSRGNSHPQHHSQQHHVHHHHHNHHHIHHNHPAAATSGTGNGSVSGSGSAANGSSSQCTSDPIKPFLWTTTLQTDLTLHVKNNVWQDSTVPNSVPNAEENAEDAIGHWNYQDPSCKANCGCSRYKVKGRPGSQNSKNSSASSAPVSGGGTNSTSALPNGPSTGGTGGATQTSTKKSEKQDKFPPRLRNITAFHRRSPVLDSLLNVACEPIGSSVAASSGDTPTTCNSNPSSNAAPPGSNNGGGGQTPQQSNLPFQYKGANGPNSAGVVLPSLRATTPSSLPQLQTPITSHGNLESPHPATPGGLMLENNASQMSNADPAMPTLSPHPPGLTEEDVKVESQEPAVTQSPAPTPEGMNNVVIKQEKQENQILSPYHQTPGSNLMSDCKAENSPSVWPLPGQTEDSASSTATTSATATVQTTSATTPTHTATTTTTTTTAGTPHSVNNVQGLKRPSLPIITHEDGDEEDLRNGLLYDYSSLASIPLEGSTTRKRLRSGPLVNPSNAYAAGVYRQDSLKQQQLEGGGELLPSKPKDPYEFNDEFDEDGPPSTGSSFRNRIDTFIKEEDKSRDPNIPSTPDHPGTPNAATPSSKETTPKQPVLNDQTSVASPPTPRNQASSFTREEDLQVTDRDLDCIFDTSSDDSSDDMFQPPSTPSSAKLSGAGDEPSSGKSTKTNNNSCTAGILGAAELTRMFPTPPSLEHNAAQSPSGPLSSSEIAVLESGDGMMRDKLDGYISCGSPGVEMDWSYVLKVPLQQKFASSHQYSALTSLPSTTLPPLNFPGESVYKPSWQQFTPSVPSTTTTVASITQSGPPSNPSPSAGMAPHNNNNNISGGGMPMNMNMAGPPQAMGQVTNHHLHPGHPYFHHHMQPQPHPHHPQPPHPHNHQMQHLHHHPHMLPVGMSPRLSHPSMMMERQQHSCHPGNMGGPGDPDRLGPGGYPMGSGGDPMDQRCMPMSYDLQSPASNSSSHLNKHLHSMESMGSVPCIPESHGLVTNLVLSDTMMNLFKDHNFAGCTICVCNMNIKGADSGLYLPDFLLPNGSDEPQYKCTCGFSAVVNRHYSHRSGLFYEDEFEITGVQYEPPDRTHRSLVAIDRCKNGTGGGANNINNNNGGPSSVRSDNDNSNTGVGGGGGGYGKELALVDKVPLHIIDLIKFQCSTLYSVCSVFHKAVSLHTMNVPPTQYNALEMADFGEMCFLALETGRQAVDNISNAKLDECLKSSILHKWPFLTAKRPPSNHETVQLLRSLQPLLQEAVQKKRTQTLWEITYNVSGPLTWRQFHRLAGRGTDDQCEPQPIPSLLVGYDKDWLGVSPFALKFWDKLLLEPYPLSRDIAYVVVAPDNEFILGRLKTFFKELSSIYEVSRLGRHCPINKVLRDGIMRVGKTAARKLADEPIDEWFNVIGNGQVASKLRLYAQVCRHHLAPHLAQQTLDKTLLDGVSPTTPMKPPEKPAASPMPPSTPESQQEKDNLINSKPVDPAHSDSQEINNLMGNTTPNSNSNSGNPGSVGANTPTPVPTSNAGQHHETGDPDEEQQAPSLVIYIVEPFSFNNMSPELYRLATLGLMRCYMQMLQFLPEHILNNIHLQLVTLDSVLSIGNGEEGSNIYNELKELAFSVFSQCRRLLVHQSSVKSLTGFGPAAAQDMFLKSKNVGQRGTSSLKDKNSGPYRMLCLPFILAPQRDKQTELGEMYGDRREKSSVFFCTYCLTGNQRWLLASCTNDKGEILENCCINIEIPNRTRRKKASALKVGLAKLFDFILGVLSNSVQAWRLVIGRLGRIGHGELREWGLLLSKKSLLHYSRQLRELCRQCSVLSSPETPCILSACLISLEPDMALRIMPDQYTPDVHFTSSCHSCDLSTPQDATCTHILVFPTSATAQSSQATFHQEHMDPLTTTLGDDDILMALNDDDIAVGNDISDIFQWTESPGNSPRRDSMSQPGSPNGLGGGRQSPFQQGGQTRGSGLTSDGQDEPLQLLQQPLALGYYVSTAKVGPLPKWFWSACPHLENALPSFLKSALLFHSPLVQQSSDDLLHGNPQMRNYHPLDSNFTTDVLRYVLEGYNALSWLSLDPETHDRRSCLPVHIQVLMQMYHAIETLT